MTLDAQITAAKGELLLARQRLREAQATLNGFRVKCATCRCMILPGEECQCCAEPPDDVEPLL